jgi:putative ABC transport system permease protein
VIAGDTLALALRNLRQAKLRTSLTVLGVAIGIASLAGMVSLGVGLEQQTIGRFTAAGVFDSITVTPAPITRLGGRGFGRGGQRGRGQAAEPTTPPAALDEEALAKIRALPDVKEAYNNVRFPVELQYDQFNGFATATGVPMSSRTEGAFQTFTAGTFFANDTDNTCLITLDLAKRITDQDAKGLVGKDLTIAYAVSATTPESAPIAGAPVAAGAMIPNRKEMLCRIAGIVEREPGAALGGGGLSGLMLPQSKAEAIDREVIRNPQSILGRPQTPSARRDFQSITVKVTSPKATEDVEDRIKQLGFGAFSLADALQQAKRAFIILDIVLSLIGSIALAVSSLGIVNTMVMSILERTREIGVMKAIGGSDADIRRIFLVEASAIGLMGGVFGVALGWLVGRIINFGANIYIERQGGTATELFALPFWLIAGAIGFSWLVSLVAGSYPAGRAAKLEPIQALRHD